MTSLDPTGHRKDPTKQTLSRARLLEHVSSLRQSGLSVRAGVSYVQLQKVKAHRSVPSLHWLWAAALALKVAPAVLLEDARAQLLDE